MKFTPMCVFDSEKYTFDYSSFDTGLFEAKECVTFVDTFFRATWFQVESRQTTWSSLPQPTPRWQTLKKKGTAWERR